MPYWRFWMRMNERTIVNQLDMYEESADGYDTARERITAHLISTLSTLGEVKLSLGSLTSVGDCGAGMGHFVHPGAVNGMGSGRLHMILQS